MPSITAIANDFFAACETGKGWEACKVYCSPNATFAAQAEPLAGIKTFAEYTDWMKGLMTIMPDGSYEVKSFAIDTERNNVAAYGVFSGTHTGPGGPCEPTGKKTTSDYVYVMQFTGDTQAIIAVKLTDRRRLADIFPPSQKQSGSPISRGDENR
jgi:predicted ester cyclase